MKKNKILLLSKIALLSTATLYITNKLINIEATSGKCLDSTSGRFYKWRNQNIYYKQKGTTGSPVILLHDLSPASSSAEWTELEDHLAKNHRVYTIDLLGCGRSDKPEIDYNGFYYVQFLVNFIESVICEKTFIVASGFTSAIALLAGSYDSKKFSGMTLINPPSIKSLSQTPTFISKVKKAIFELPLIGTYIYNLIHTRIAIDNSLTENYFYNPFMEEETLIESFYKGAHLQNSNGRFLYASLSGNYLNINIEHALKNNSVYTDIIVGEALDDGDFISRSWKRLNPSINIFPIEQTKKLPHYEKGELTAFYIESSIESAANKRNEAKN